MRFLGDSSTPQINSETVSFSSCGDHAEFARAHRDVGLLGLVFSIIHRVSQSPNVIRTSFTHFHSAMEFFVFPINVSSHQCCFLLVENIHTAHSVAQDKVVSASFIVTRTRILIMCF